MVRNYLVIARVSIDFDGWYGATEDYILGHSQSKMVADSYAATLNRELELYKEGKDDFEIITDYKFLWVKDIIDDTMYVYYKNADKITVSFVVVETENIDTDLNNVDVCKEARYKPVILQEHDAESRRLRAILDTATEEIYVKKMTRHTADILGITIEEERNERTSESKEVEERD